jgi:hypothetical protein
LCFFWISFHLLLFLSVAMSWRLKIHESAKEAASGGEVEAFDAFCWSLISLPYREKMLGVTPSVTPVGPVVVAVDMSQPQPLLPLHFDSQVMDPANTIPKQYRVDCPLCQKQLHVNSLRKHYENMRHYKLDRRGNPVTRIDRNGKHRAVLLSLPAAIRKLQNAYRREWRSLASEASASIPFAKPPSSSSPLMSIVDAIDTMSVDEGAPSPMEGEESHTEVEEEDEVIDLSSEEKKTAIVAEEKDKPVVIVKPIPRKAPRRATFNLPSVDKSYADTFIRYLTSKARGSLSLTGNAEQQGSNYCRFIKFERPSDWSDHKIFLAQDDAQGGLPEIGRAHRFLEILDEEYGAKTKTLVNWIQSLLSIWKWRLMLFSHLSVRNKEQDAGLRRYEDIIRVFTAVRQGYQKADIKTPKKTLADLISNGEWITMTELREITIEATPRFDELCRKPSEELLPADIEFGLRYAIFYYYANQPAVRPQIIQSVTLADWAQIEADGVYTTSVFKTKQTYGNTTLILSPECVKVWKQYKDHFRVRSAHLASASQPSAKLFIRSSGAPLKNVARELHPFITRFKPGSHITPTTIRKAIAVEAIDRLSKQDADSIHRGDTHSVSVVNSYYDMKASVRVAENANQSYRKLIESSPPLPSPSPFQPPPMPPPPLAQSTAVAASPLFPVVPPVALSVSAPVRNLARRTIVLAAATANPVVTSTPYDKKRKRVPWTDEEKQIISDWCDSHGEDNRRWAECLETHRNEFLPEHRSAVGIKDCYRNIQQQTSKKAAKRIKLT